MKFHFIDVMIITVIILKTEFLLLIKMKIKKQVYNNKVNNTTDK